MDSKAQPPIQEIPTQCLPSISRIGGRFVRGATTCVTLTHCFYVTAYYRTLTGRISKAIHWRRYTSPHEIAESRLSRATPLPRHIALKVGEFRRRSIEELKAAKPPHRGLTLTAITFAKGSGCAPQHTIWRDFNPATSGLVLGL
jgi:hypothetical protein